MIAFLRVVTAVSFTVPLSTLEDRISWISLRKDGFLVSVIPISHPSTELFAQHCVTDTETTFTRHSDLPL